VSIPPAQAETAALLQRLSGSAPIETHISLVFPGADTVWKLKKAVRLPFLDFSDAAQRRHFALRELELNGPAAPGLYRDVVAVRRAPDGGLALGDGAGAPIDWVLRMARVPAADFLDALAASGGLDAALLTQVADEVAAYHAGLPPLAGIDPVAAMARIAAGNADSAGSAGLPADAVAAWHDAMRRSLAAIAPWQLARAASGMVRRTHGDLHLGNLCLWQGRPVPFDALEFDEDLARTDLAYDLAFLLMDLDRRVGRPSANLVLNRYVARSGDAGLVAGLPPFLSMRAMVRAHVARRSFKHGEADAYLGAALAYLHPPPPVLVGIGGLQGTGKSTLARALAPALGAAPGALVLRSDEIRKRLCGAAPEDRLPPRAYTGTVGRRVFAALTEDARRAAAAGHAVIADATFLDPAHRAALAAAALAAGVRFVGLWLHAPLPVLESRVAARQRDASDATVTVLHATHAAHPHPPGDWTPIDATDGAAALAEAQAAVMAGR
jgi:aminoglycoside phosphotransferase family enzyme/predicted kinase